MSPDIRTTLEAIGEVAVHHCGHCDAPLSPDSPSALFCSPEHQAAWHEARSVALAGYREPRDIPVHIDNQREMSSPETTPEPQCHCGRSLFPWNLALGVCTRCEDCDGDCEPFDRGTFDRWLGDGPGRRCRIDPGGPTC